VAVIYRITNMVNGNYYIGSAESFERRKWQHLYDLKRGVHKNPRLQAAWNKYGGDMFVFEILEEIPADRQTFDVENTYLMKCVGQPDCYNVNVDAFKPRQGIPHTEEAKEKMRAAAVVALSEGRGGKFIPSEETRAKMSASAKGNQNALGYKRTAAERAAIRQRVLGNQNFLGKQHSEESKDKLRRPLFAVLPDGSKRKFSGVKAAGEELGIAYQMLVRVVKSGKVVVKGRFSGWLFFYEDAPAAVAAVPEEYAHLPRTRRLAKEQGSPTYFTGDPCKHGHVAPRSTKGACTVCRKSGLA
jgi:group I intron endonuclease